MPAPYKTQAFRRLDELGCRQWRPLSVNELRMLAPIKLTTGRVDVDRHLLARLLGEHDRLVLIAESARWLVECAERDGLFGQPDYVDASDSERSMALLAAAIRTVDEDGGGERIVASA